jgi:DivIVA domain-containing protein
VVWWEVLGGVVVLLGLAFALSRGAETLPDEPDDAADVGLPEGRLLRSDDIGRLRFRVGLRGYRMSDVDAALEAARLALQALEARMAPGDTDSAEAPSPAEAPGPVEAPQVRPDAASPGGDVTTSSELTEQPPAVVDRPLSQLEAEQAAGEGRAP